jgi:cytochrome c oxidase subunit 2
MNLRRALPLLAAGLALGGCAGVQSALMPAGEEAHQVDLLFWIVTGLLAAITGLVTILVAVALMGPPRWRERLSAGWIVWGGGIVFPVVVLTGVFVYGLVVLQAADTRARAAAEPSITVTGKRWWWEVVYTGPDGQPVASANELRLPAGTPVAIRLESDDVIHSFWVPRLAGKLDMIPGRTNVLTLQATEPGLSRGQCAEYCGGAHALMAFWVEVLPQAEYDAWLAREASHARPPQTAEQARGRDVFMENGCGACHTIRGTGAAGVLGPDLTHVGSRHSLAAAALPNTRAAIASWIVENQHIKPENLMPDYDILTPEDLDAVAAYLESLD